MAAKLAALVTLTIAGVDTNGQWWGLGKCLATIIEPRAPQLAYINESRHDHPVGAENRKGLEGKAG